MGERAGGGGGLEAAEDAGDGLPASGNDFDILATGIGEVEDDAPEDAVLGEVCGIRRAFYIPVRPK